MGAKRIMVQGGKRPVQSLGYVNFTKVIFRPIKRLKFIGSWFPDTSAKFYSGCQERIQQSQLQTLCIFRFEDLIWGINSIVRTSQELDFRSITTSKNRELTQLRRWRQLWKNDRFNDQNNSSASASRFLVLFFLRPRLHDHDVKPPN